MHRWVIAISALDCVLGNSHMKNSMPLAISIAQPCTHGLSAYRQLKCLAWHHLLAKPMHLGCGGTCQSPKVAPRTPHRQCADYDKAHCCQRLQHRCISKHSRSDVADKSDNTRCRCSNRLRNHSCCDRCSRRCHRPRLLLASLLSI